MSDYSARNNLTSWPRWWPLIAILCALGPFAAGAHRLLDLYWFGDDWDLLKQIHEQGFASWIWVVFAENFVPVFKIAWGGMVYLTKGSYSAMIASLWLSHAVVVALLGLVLQRAGYSYMLALFVLAGVGLASSNLETLAWSVQWSAILSVVFFLLGLSIVLKRANLPQDKFEVPWHAALGLCSLLSALSFSRGVLTGPALVLLVILCRPSKQPWWQRIAITGTCCALPSIVVAAIIAHASSGNHQAGITSENAVSIARFATGYFFVNPMWRLLHLDLLASSPGLPTCLFVGAIKTILVALGLLRGSGRGRALLVCLLFVDIGNAGLLGLGRHHTGLDAAFSMRYQYASLICTLPFFAVAFRSGVATPSPLRRTLQVLGLVVFVICALWQWPAQARSFVNWRGPAIRDAIAQASDETPIPSVPFITTKQARDLTVLFNLH
jgi:hypothetical protein